MDIVKPYRKSENFYHVHRIWESGSLPWEKVEVAGDAHSLIARESHVAIPDSLGQLVLAPSPDATVPNIEAVWPKLLADYTSSLELNHDDRACFEMIGKLQESMATGKGRHKQVPTALFSLEAGELVVDIGQGHPMRARFVIPGAKGTLASPIGFNCAKLAALLPVLGTVTLKIRDANHPAIIDSGDHYGSYKALLMPMSA